MSACLHRENTTEHKERGNVTLETVETRNLKMFKKFLFLLFSMPVNPAPNAFLVEMIHQIKEK